jgi:hypothetical protein
VAPERLTVRTAGGLTVQLERPLIRSMSPSTGVMRDGRVWPRDPNLTRLFFGPTARMLGQGEGYLGAFELFLPFVSYGVSDFFTVAGGTPFIPTEEIVGRIWYLAPKFGANVTPRTAVAAGVLAFVDLGTDDDIDPLGIAYGVATQGGEDRAVTLGIGWGFAGSDVENRPVFLAGGEYRASPRVKLLSENYLITYREEVYRLPSTTPVEETKILAMLSGGVRFIGERLSADAGVGLMVDDDESFCCLPLVNFVYNFGRPR